MACMEVYNVRVCSLSNLESLELRENLIKYLPASLSCLVRLKTLDLGSNLIDELVGLFCLSHHISCLVVFIDPSPHRTAAATTVKSTHSYTLPFRYRRVARLPQMPRETSKL